MPTAHITLPVTTGVEGDRAFAHTGPNVNTGLAVYEPLAGHPTPGDAMAEAVRTLSDHIHMGYLPTKDSRKGSND